jgi:hypothetical protein
MTQNILYVTSFSEMLFKESGHKLINTFLDYKIEGHLLVCYEGFDFPSIVNCPENISTVDIMKYDFLEKWLINNKTRIPTVFGGSIPETGKLPPNVTEADRKNVYKYWNRKASLWFRKIASLHYAYNVHKDKYNYDAIVWIDCDCFFIQNMTTNFVFNIFGNNDVFYHQGNYRNSKDFGFETGIIGFRNRGYNLLSVVFKTYESGKYSILSRWDDGYVFKHIIYKMVISKLISAIDLVDSNITSGKKLDAVTKGPFKMYIVHKKGIHTKLPNLEHNR